ncbi:MAG: hypothetical protein ACRDYZ_13240 [Acidimicrobiales bacterium]
MCLAAVTQLRSAGFYVAHADLLMLPSLERFAEVLVDQVWSNRPSPRRTARAVGRGGRSAAIAVGAAATARLRTELGDGVDLAFDPSIERRNPRRYFEHAVRLLQRICDHDVRSLILFLDELQEIGAETWRKRLGRRGERARVRFELAALDRLMELGEGQVRTTMLLAQQAYVAALAEDREGIDPATVEVALAQALNADAAAHQAVVEQFRAMGRRTLNVAVRVASDEPPYVTGSPSTAKRALDALSAQGLVEQRGVVGRGGWVVPDPLLRRYLRRLG